MMKGYKIRLFPTKEQELLLWKHIDACRFVWNWMLAKREELYHADGTHLSAYDMIYLLKPLKNDGEHGWLYETAAASHTVVCRDLSAAYQLFYEHKANLPKFKSKKSKKQSFPTTGQDLYFTEQWVNITKVGHVKYKTDFALPTGSNMGKFYNPRIVYRNGKWLLGFCMQSENQAVQLTDKTMGIDLGIKQLATAAIGDECITIPNINKSKKMRMLDKRIRYYHHAMSRKYEANKVGTEYRSTKNIEKIERKMRRDYTKMSNIRQNHIHQSTHMLVEKRPHRVVMETLRMTQMMKNHYLSKLLFGQNFFEFTRQMEYKCASYGIEFIKADQFFPSSKLCSNCGSIKKQLALSERIYQCDSCGLVMDRDLNAAINLMRYVV